MSREILREAASEARIDSYNGANRLLDALADWWLSEAEAHFHGASEPVYLYDLPGMDQTPAVRAARAYLGGDGA